MAITKGERLLRFLTRLQGAAQAATADEAFELLTRTLNAVEDELTDVPYDPLAWQTDGRLYPPHVDSRRDVAGRPDVTRYRSRSHNTFIAANGAIEIHTIEGVVIFSKPGADGHSIWKR